MANIFAILTAVVLAVAGFLAYVNTGSSEEKQRGYRGWIAQREAEERSLANNRGTLGDLQDTIKKTDANLADVKGRNEGLQAEVDAQLEENKKLADQLAEKKKTADRLAAELKSIEENFVPIEEVKELVDKLNRTKDQLRDLKLVIGEKEAGNAGLEGQKRSTQNTIGDLKGQLSWRLNNKSNPALRTSVRSVYGGLGFVTLAGGNNLGIVKNSPLNVVRNGEVIGKLIVTTVEATSSAADIVPDSVPAGMSVFSGDRVVVAEEKKKAAN